MNWSDYEDVWKRQPDPRGARADLEDLTRTFAKQDRKLTANLAVRDYAEASTGVFVASVVAFVWRGHGGSAWPLALAILIILAVTAVFLRERIRAHRNRPSPDASLLAKVESDLAELRHQQNMVSKLWWWYLGPILVAMMIVVFTISFHRPAWDPTRPYFHHGLLDIEWPVAWVGVVYQSKCCS